MTNTPPPALAPDARRDTGIILSIISVMITVPTVLGTLIDWFLVPEVLPPEIMLFSDMPAFIFVFTWWLFGALVLIGFVLIIRAPRRRGTLVFAIVTIASWILAIVSQIARGYLF